MVKSPELILDNYRQHAARSKVGLDSASKMQNPDLIAFNIGQGFRACLMQGLVGWRCGITCPINAFKEALTFCRDGLSAWQEMRGNACIKSLHIPLEKALFVAFLVEGRSAEFDLSELAADRRLDAVLGRALYGDWDEELWNSGLDQLRQIKGSTLAVESYMIYKHLLLSQDRGIEAVAENAFSLFLKRRSNTYYSAGEPTDGGGNYNTITVDYRLASIMKQIGFKLKSAHSWNWV